MDKIFSALLVAFIVCGIIGAFWGLTQPEPSAIGGFFAGIIVAGVGATVIAALAWIAAFLGIK